MAWSTHRVSRLLTERDTISVPVTLDHTAITSRPPATAATTRPASGITMASPSAAPATPKPIRGGAGRVISAPVAGPAARPGHRPDPARLRGRQRRRAGSGRGPGGCRGHPFEVTWHGPDGGAGHRH